MGILGDPALQLLACIRKLPELPVQGPKPLSGRVQIQRFLTEIRKCKRNLHLLHELLHHGKGLLPRVVP